MSDSVHMPTLTLRGIERIGPSSFNESVGSGANFAAEMWHEFIEKLIEHEIALDGVMYGVSWPADNNVPPQQVHYFCGLEGATEIPDMQLLVVDAGNYFDFHCEVLASNLDLGFHEAYNTALPASGLIPRDGKHLEIYGNEYDPAAEIARFRILIPVK